MRRLGRAPWIQLAVLAAAVAMSSASADASDEGGLDIDGARAGLHALTTGMEPVGEYEPFTECPVVSRDAVVDALETAGLDTPLATFDRIGGPVLGDGAALGVVCSGAYVGSEQDTSFPETLATLVVAELVDADDVTSLLGDDHVSVDDAEAFATPTLGAATFGACREIDLHTRCVEYWQHDAFVIGVQVDDRVHVDRPTASAVLVALVPAIVDTLVAVPEPVAPVEFAATDEQLDAARGGLANLIDSPNVPAAPDECSMVEQQAVDAALSNDGIDAAIEGWTEALTIGTDAAGDPDADAVGIRCRSLDDHGTITIVVIDYGDSAVAQEVIELVQGCERMGSTTFCVETWEQDGLSVTVTMTAPDAERDAAARLLEALVPIVLDSLADAA